MVSTQETESSHSERAALVGFESTSNKYGSSGADDDACNSDTANETHSSEKSIGMLGSIAIAVNSLAGPAVLQLPFQYQQSGLIPTTICLIAVGTLSALCSLHMANTVSLIPGNARYDCQVEFSDTFRIFWGRRAYKVTQILFYFTAVCLNVAAIVDTAEVVDSAIGLHGIPTAALNFGSGQVEIWQHEGACTRRQVKLGLCQPFGDEDEYGNFIITAGYLITAAVFLPICLMDLKENAVGQIFGFGVLMTLCAYFCWEFGVTETLSLKHVSVWGHAYADMMGVILFNFALVLAIPAWLHEKKPSVSVEKTVVQSTAIATALYVAVGALGALAIPKVNLNMLNPMVSGAYGPGLQWTGSVFAFFIIGLDIPLFSVLTRYNLTHSGLCSERTANLVVVWIPWALAWVFYQGDAIGQLLDWGGVLLTSAVAFILPLWLSLRAVVRAEGVGQVHVYGVPLSKKKHVLILTVLLCVAVFFVAMAIGGQVIAEEAREAYIHSPAYLNGTAMAPAAPALAVAKEPHHKHSSVRGHHLDPVTHVHLNSTKDTEYLPPIP